MVMTFDVDESVKLKGKTPPWPRGRAPRYPVSEQCRVRTA